jgi:hypothetical protein
MVRRLAFALAAPAARLRRHVTYSSVMSTVAVFIALGGISYAAIKLPANSVGTKQLRAKAVTLKKINPKARKKLRGKAGARGSRGPQGLPGAAGAPGASGASGAALLTGLATGVPSFSSGTIFRRVPVTGHGDASVSNATSDIASLSPARTLVARDISVRVENDLPVGGSTNVALFVNSVPSEVSPVPTQFSCSVVGTAGSSDRTCSAPGPITIPPGSFMWIRVTNSGGATTSDPATAYWGITIEPAQG